MPRACRATYRAPSEQACEGTHWRNYRMAITTSRHFTQSFGPRQPAHTTADRLDVDVAAVKTIAAARAVDREFNYNFGSNLGLFSSGSDFNGRGAPIGFILAKFQLKRSHSDLFHLREFV